jgi:hypothetical protein|tara:strand:- start:860 stop:1312 length:453 start_codon:yes stop_codon:yes gene_type:complete
MALWKFTNLNKYGNPRSRIIYKPNGIAFSHGPGFGSFVNVQRFKYKHKHEILPPSLFTNVKGEKFIVPGFQKVDLNTTLNDIQWVKPKIKVTRSKTIEKTFKSSSNDSTYTTKYYPDSGKYFCECPGSWRSMGNCKHIKQMRNEKNNKGN